MLPESLIAGGLVVVFTAIGCLRVRQSVSVAALLTVVEIGGLLFVVAAGSPALLSLPDRAASMLPTDPAQWSAVAAGAFLAFFAFIGRSEEHTSELQSLMRISYAVFCLKKKKTTT